MKKVRIIKRDGLPETNSSSSHSVVIDMSNYFPDSEVFSLPMDENNNIHIPGNINFGWEWEKYNDALTKIQYVCGIICDKNPKKVKQLKEIVKNFTGANNVIFDWEEDYKKRIEAGEEPEDVWKAVPEIDHNSSDIFCEITENKDTLKNFIFNPNSWLFLGNDNGGDSEQFFKIANRDTGNDLPAVIQVYLPEPVGRFDIPLENFPEDSVASKLFYHSYYEENEEQYLRYFRINKKTGECILTYDMLNIANNMSKNFKNNDLDDLLVLFPGFLDTETGENYYIYFISKEISFEFLNTIAKDYPDHTLKEYVLNPASGYNKDNSLEYLYSYFGSIFDYGRDCVESYKEALLNILEKYKDTGEYIRITVKIVSDIYGTL